MNCANMLMMLRLTKGCVMAMAEDMSHMGGKATLMELERCFMDVKHAWERYRLHDMTEEHGKVLEDRLVELSQVAVRLALAENLDGERVARPISQGSGAGTRNAISGRAECGMSLPSTFDEPLESGDAFWSSSAECRQILVHGIGQADSSDEWNFGTEWHENVARHVSYCHLTDRGTQNVTILFNDAFDENAVDLRATDGRTHIVLAQGLVPMSLSEIWKGIGYKWRWHTAVDNGRTCDVLFPVVSVMAKNLGEPLLTIRCDGNGPETENPDGTDGESTGEEISFTDSFAMFVYNEPFDGYDATVDFDQVPMPEMAVLVNDIKFLQQQAQSLVEFDPCWGRDENS